MHTAETGGTTVSICHPSRVEGVKALWTPHTHTVCWLEKCWLINMTSWHACHLRKPPVHRYTLARTVTTYVPPLGQHRSHAPRCGLQPVFGTSPPPPQHYTEGLSDVWRNRCEMWRILSVMRAFNGRARLCIWGEWLIHWACSVDTVQQRSYYLSGYFATTDSDLNIYE